VDDMSSFVVALAEALPTGAGDPALGVMIDVTEVELSLPIEARFCFGNPIELSTPRGRMSTGFGVEHGRIKLVFERCSPLEVEG
jgi:hypothetical protein